MSISEFPLAAIDSRPDGTPPELQVLSGGRAAPGAGAKELGAHIVALAGRVASAQCRWLLLVAQFDALEGAGEYGLPTTTRWLSHHCGIAARTARDHLKVAHTLAAYPMLAESMGAGRISYSHVRIIAGTAGPDEPELVSDLLNLAEHGTVHQLEDIALGLRSVDRQLDDPIRPASQGSGESLSRTWDRDARRHLTARLDPEHGAMIDAALTAVQAVAPDGERLTAVEALVRMAEITLATLADSPTPPRLPRGHERAALVLHLHAIREAGPGIPDEAVSGADNGSREPHLDPIHDPDFEIPDEPVSGLARSSREPLPLVPDNDVGNGHVDPSTLFDTDTAIEDEHDNVTPEAAGNRWDGYRMSRSYAINCLAAPRYRARDNRRNRQAS